MSLFSNVLRLKILPRFFPQSIPFFRAIVLCVAVDVELYCLGCIEG